jgi:uncharacterized membrane protein YidH (DUF202 family)
MIDGAEFERCFMEWIRQLAGLTSKVIAVDKAIASYFSRKPPKMIRNQVF